MCGLAAWNSPKYQSHESPLASSQHVKFGAAGRVAVTERRGPLGWGRGICAHLGPDRRPGPGRPRGRRRDTRQRSPAVHPGGRHCGTNDPTSSCGPSGGAWAAGGSPAKGATLTGAARQGQLRQGEWRHTGGRRLGGPAGRDRPQAAIWWSAATQVAKRCWWA
jgi:hypothetical protein